MYVIKKDGIKRYVGEIKKEIPSGKFKNAFIKYMYNLVTLVGELKIPKGITMLAVCLTIDNINEYPILYLKVVPNQIVGIRITGDSTGSAYSDGYSLYEFIVNGKNILSDTSPSLGLNLMRGMYITCDYSEEINNYKGGAPIIDIRNFPTISEEEYNKNPKLHFERIDDK